MLYFFKKTPKLIWGSSVLLKSLPCGVRRQLCVGFPPIECQTYSVSVILEQRRSCYPVSAMLLVDKLG